MTDVNASPDQEDRGPAWVSDGIVDLLGRLGIEFLAINPGASLRGLHDSLVNYAAKQKPELLLCLHEEHAVAIAHGYAKVTGRPMAVGLHSNVGLMHGSMAIYNAWCDRVPVLALGATGPVDATKRRAWIDWIHTAADQGALVRNFVKWDDAPTSAGAAVDSVLRAHAIARSAPSGPVYVCLDAALQEDSWPAELELPDVSRYGPNPVATPNQDDVARAVELLKSATNPVLLVGRVGHDEKQWQDRIGLAEKLGAHVISDSNCGSTFPTAHPLMATAPAPGLGADAVPVVRDADVIVNLGWVDLGSSLTKVFGRSGPVPPVIYCDNDDTLWNGWSKDHGALAPADVTMPVPPDSAVRALLATVQQTAFTGATERTRRAGHESAAPEPPASEGTNPGPRKPLRLADLGTQLRQLHAQENVTFLRLPLRWSGEWLDFSQPLDYLGYDGGGGLGSGPGMAVGGALALRGSDRLPVAVLGDGDVMMGNSALWTAAHYGIPLLLVVANNRTYGNDEVHQVRVARARQRPEERSWVGQRMAEPEIDYAQLARSQGCVGIGPASRSEELADALTEAVSRVKAGQTVVVDVHLAEQFTSTGEH